MVARCRAGRNSDFPNTAVLRRESLPTYRQSGGHQPHQSLDIQPMDQRIFLCERQAIAELVRMPANRRKRPVAVVDDSARAIRIAGMRARVTSADFIGLAKVRLDQRVVWAAVLLPIRGNFAKPRDALKRLPEPSQLPHSPRFLL